MPDTKRNISQVAVDSLEHDDKKANTSKVGRKPIDTEPKSRRTAQNRAAQRAYRERKERKMKDLEEKVALLEDDKMKALSEQDILKAQIDLLKRELSRVTGQTNVSVPNSNFSFSSNKNASPLSSNDKTNQWSWNSTTSDSTLLLQSSQQLPDLVSASSSSTSPLNDNVNATPNLSSLDANSNLDTISSNLNMISTFDESVNPFCAKLSEACGGAGKPEPKVRRWGNPVPPYVDSTDALFALPNYESPFQSLFSPNENLADPFFAEGNPASNLNLPTHGDQSQNDPLAFLNDAGFDVSLAFGNSINDVVEKGGAEVADDKLSSLVTEESLFDSISHPSNEFDFNEYIKDTTSSAITSRSNSEAGGRHTVSSMSSFNNSPTIFEESNELISAGEVIPAGAKTMKCSEIWDRITTHPRYTEIDIDGLCKELQTKAKCSEKGVVINVNDVTNIIERSAIKKE